MTTLGLNQTGLADELGVSKQIISDWLNNRKYPKASLLLKLSKTLKMDYAELVERVEDEFTPIVAFRKKKNHKIPESYFTSAKQLGDYLSKLVPYLPFDTLTEPPTLKNPSTEYDYLQKVAEAIRERIGKAYDDAISYRDLMNYFQQYQTVVIPALLGEKQQHENALHIFLPETKTTWVYLNIECNYYDFNFWIAHELGHSISPTIDDMDLWEDFADSFAQNLLITEPISQKIYQVLSKTNSPGAKVNKLKDFAVYYHVAPLTVFKQVNNYALQANRQPISFRDSNQIFKINQSFTKEHPEQVSERLSQDHKDFEISRYIEIIEREFQTPIFETLRSYAKENEIGHGLIQKILKTEAVRAKDFQQWIEHETKECLNYG